MKIPFFNRELKQRCADLEFMLLKFVQQKDVSDFEKELFSMWDDPIAYITGNEDEKQLHDAYMNLSDKLSTLEGELDHKYKRYRYGE